MNMPRDQNATQTRAFNHVLLADYLRHIGWNRPAHRAALAPLLACHWRLHGLWSSRSLNVSGNFNPATGAFAHHLELLIVAEGVETSD
ncbi:MAG: hypothetical protein M1154_18190 [Gammaproteobacteria bacterium]|nr:hypothetical protein [Gammaproteobacteria bacterium]